MPDVEFEFDLVYVLKNAAKCKYLSIYSSHLQNVEETLVGSKEFLKDRRPRKNATEQKRDRTDIQVKMRELELGLVET